MSNLREQAAEVRRAANIVDVISTFVRLKKAGRNYVGLCPFHADKDPSFTVNEAKGFFYCFGCKAGGDVVTFIKLYRNCSYYEALQELADRYGIELKKYDHEKVSKEKDIREELLQVNKIAAEFYHKTLVEEAHGLPARVYLKERDIPPAIVREQKLGYALNKWDSLLKFLSSRNVPVQLALKAGLIVEHKKGLYRDRFRHRLMFPIRNSRGQIIAFGGRTLDNNIPPKYMNSPETPIYHKGRVLYCYHIAREACRSDKSVLVVEGYLDLLRLHASGIRSVVATLGTALTRQHVRLLERIAEEAVLVFDGDESGVKAASRSLELFLLEQFPARCVVLPDNLDPDDYVQKYGAESFRDLLDEALELTEFYIEQKVASYDDTLESRARLIDELLPVIKDVSNPVVRGVYISKIAEKTGISESAISQRFKELKSGAGRGKYRRNGFKSDDAGGIEEVCPLEESILKVLLHNPGFLSQIDAEKLLSLFGSTTLRKILEAVIEIWRKQGSFGIEELLHETADQGCESQVVDLWVSSQCWNTESEALTHLKNKIGALEERVIEEKKKEILSQISDAEAKGDVTKLKELLNKFEGFF
ncbi:MAG: DNA primase [Deltaproteobacteria bacterium]|nr:MAG: DNA primase [Deltaproteobacteria bacterium]RLB09351.1 MAG: DNA primase [Deltaproteobacteria bacterium]